MMICETFRSLQGEGQTIGVPTVFIRTVGCNLSCSWCDTGYAMSGGTEMSVDQIMASLDGTRDICVTGGEPLLQPDMPELLSALVADGRRVVLETNGSTDISKVPRSDSIIVSMDIKCPASGMSDRMMLSNLDVLKPSDQLKFVIDGRDDLEYAVAFLREHPVTCTVLFSPVGGMDLEYLADEVVRRKLDVRVLPQLHKIIWGDRRSV